MASAYAVGAASFVIMAAALTYGFGWGQFRREGRVLIEMVWGQVALIDVYVGFALFAFWVGWREASAWRGLAWFAAICCLGNLITAAYVLWAARACGGDWQRFWMGRRANAT
jgi:hypothetical protein